MSGLPFNQAARAARRIKVLPDGTTQTTYFMPQRRALNNIAIAPQNNKGLGI